MNDTAWITPEGAYLLDSRLFSSCYMDERGCDVKPELHPGMGKKEVEFAISVMNYIQTGMDLEVRQGTREEMEAWVAGLLDADRKRSDEKKTAKKAEEEQKRRAIEEHDRILKNAEKDPTWTTAWKAARARTFEASCDLSDAAKALEKAEEAEERRDEKVEKATKKLERATAADEKARDAEAKLWERAKAMV